MTEGFPQHWYLELEGKRMGPFSPEQVLGLLADGEIPEGLYVTPEFEGSTSTGPMRMTAAAMRDTYFSDDRIPTALGDGDFHITPSLPAASLNIPDAQDESHGDAAQHLATSRRLFELFQAARDRRTKFAPASTDEKAKVNQQASGLSAWVKSPISAAVAASLVATIAVRQFNRAPDMSESTQRELAEAKPLSSVPVDGAPRSAPVTVSKPSKIQNNWQPSPSANPKITVVAGGVVRESAHPAGQASFNHAPKHLQAARAAPTRSAPPPPAPSPVDNPAGDGNVIDNWADKSQDPNNPPNPEAQPPVQNLANDAGLNPGQAAPPSDAPQFPDGPPPENPEN